MKAPRVNPQQMLRSPKSIRFHGFAIDPDQGEEKCLRVTAENEGGQLTFRLIQDDGVLVLDYAQARVLVDYLCELLEVSASASTLPEGS